MLRGIRLLLAILTFSTFASAAAATTLDQEALPLASGLTFLHDNDTDLRQGFVAGRSGLLTRVDVYVSDLFGGESCCALRLFGADAQTLLATVSLDGQTASAGWVSFLLAAPLAVTAGQPLWFDIEHDNVLRFAAASHASGALDWSCNLDGCANPFRSDPGFAASALGDGSLVVFCAAPGGDCSLEWTHPYDPNELDVEPWVGFHMPIDAAFRTFVAAEPTLLALLVPAAGFAARSRSRARSGGRREAERSAAR